MSTTRTPFIVCKASAGSGKTHTLVKEYLKMAFGGGEEEAGTRFRHILAITFTNKAAAEMKSRIVGELREMAAAPVDPQRHCMGADIMREMGIADGAMMSRMAQRLHCAILHHYSDLSVSTIDSFMHRIVRTFAHDLGLPMKFDIEVEERELTEQAVAGLMSLAGTEGQEELTEVLIAFANSQMENEKSYRIERQIADLAGLIYKEDIDQHLAKLKRLSLADFQKIHCQLNAERRAFERDLRQAGADMLRIANEAGIDPSAVAHGTKGYYNHFANVAGGSLKVANSYVVAAMEEGKLCSPKASAAQKAAAEAAWPLMRNVWSRYVEMTTEGMARYNGICAVLQQLYSTALLGVLDKQMRLYARDQELMHLSDFNKLINHVVQDEEDPAPFVFERLGNRYRHFLIDEFQDTSVMQWHNLVPLLENGISQGYASLVVGDGKQAIYRFRQGDVRQFAVLPRVEGMQLHGRVLTIPGNSAVQLLDTNYRTASAIVEFNNRFFAWAVETRFAHNPLLQQLYADATQLQSKSQRGYLDIEFVSKTDCGENTVREEIFDRILKTIVHLIEERGYRYGDIIVLARSNAELANIGKHIAEHSTVPQTSTETFLLHESDAVLAVVDTLRLLHDRTDSVAAADLLHRLAALGLIETDSLHQRIEALHTSTEAALRGLPGLDIDRLRSLDLYTCCEEIVRQLTLDGVEQAYVASLLGRVAGMVQRHRGRIDDFLQWFDAKENLSAASSDELDAVRMLTIHKAKGLEAPVVICPLMYGSAHPADVWVDMDEGPLPTAYVSLKRNETTIFNKELDQELMMSEVDDLNILYVALTRPRERLYLFCPDPHDIKNRREQDLRYPSLLRDFVDTEGYDQGIDEPATEHKTHSTKQAIGLEKMTFADWREKVHVASPSERALNPLREEKIRFGIYAHDLLSTIAHADDTEAAAARFAAANEVDETEMQRLVDLAHRATTDDTTRRFFDPHYEARCECELVADGRRLRPDRVVTTQDQTWVIDFKTGTPLPDHRSQVSEYCRALRAMGMENVSGYLLYLLPEISVVEV